MEPRNSVIEQTKNENNISTYSNHTNTTNNTSPFDTKANNFKYSNDIDIKVNIQSVPITKSSISIAKTNEVIVYNK